MSTTLYQCRNPECSHHFLIEDGAFHTADLKMHCDQVMTTEELPDQVIVQPYVIYDIESGDPQDDYPDGHTIKRQASEPSLVYSTKIEQIAAWLELRGYVKVEELSNRTFASDIDGIYARTDGKPLQVGEQVQLALVGRGIAKDNPIVRDYLRTIEERQLTQFGIAVGDATFIHIWYPDDLATPGELVDYAQVYRAQYPKASFLLYDERKLREVERTLFFARLNAWKRKDREA